MRDTWHPGFLLCSTPSLFRCSGVVLRDNCEEDFIFTVFIIDQYADNIYCFEFPLRILIDVVAIVTSKPMRMQPFFKTEMFLQ